MACAIVKYCASHKVKLSVSPPYRDVGTLHVRRILHAEGTYRFACETLSSTKQKRLAMRCTVKDSNLKRQKRLISFLPFGLLVNGYFLPFLMIFSVLARSNSHNITELPYKMIDTLITAFFGYFCK